MIVSDVIARVRSTFGDAAAVQVQDTDIYRWINDAQVEIVKRNDTSLSITTFSNLVANQASYTLPTDYLLLRSLRYKTASMYAYSALKYMSVQEFDESLDGWDGSSYTAGSPSYFTVDDGKLILFPTPDTSATNGLKIRYNQKPTDVTSGTDALSLPLIYHNTIVKYCLWQASLLDEDNEVAVMHQGNFMDDVSNLKNRDNRDPTDTYPTITVLEYDL